MTVTYRHTDATDSTMFSLAPILPMFDVRCANRPNSSPYMNREESRTSPIAQLPAASLTDSCEFLVSFNVVGLLFT